MSEGTVFGKQATEQIAKTVREHSRRQQYQTPQRGRWTGRSSSISTTTITGAAGTCGCGVQYARGSQSVTINSVAYEHATTYNIAPVCKVGTWEFPEATYDTGSNWVTGAETIYTCGSAGTLTAELTLTPCGYRTVCGQDVLQAKIVLATVADDCEIDPAPAAVWICDHWNPLGPMNTFTLVQPLTTPYSVWTFPPVLCVTTSVSVVETCPGVLLPEKIRISGITLSSTGYSDCNSDNPIPSLIATYNGVQTIPYVHHQWITEYHEDTKAGCADGAAYIIRLRQVCTSPAAMVMQMDYNSGTCTPGTRVFIWGGAITGEGADATIAFTFTGTWTASYPAGGTLACDATDTTGIAAV